MNYQLVRLHMPTSDESRERLSEIENQLAIHFEENPIGEYDGNEIGEGQFTVWLYGADADQLAKEVQKVLGPLSVPTGSFLFLRHGSVEDENAQVQKIPL